MLYLQMVKGSENKKNDIAIMAEIDAVDVNAIVEYASNPKDHPQSQIDRLAAGIKEFGFFGQLVLNNKKDKQIIVGHGRLRAAKKLGMLQVPCVYAEHLSDNQVKALRIFDNRVSELGTINKDLLALEMLDLKDLGFDLNLTGYADGEFKLTDGDVAKDFKPKLPSGNKEPLRAMTFTVSDEQYDIIAVALKSVRKKDLVDPQGVNENQNGNALYFLCKEYSDRQAALPQVNSTIDVEE